MTVRSCTEIREVHGDGALSAVVAEDKRTGERHSIQTRALFVFIGADPNTHGSPAPSNSTIAASCRPVRQRCIRTPTAQGRTERQPMMLDTSRPGVFAAGDVRSGSVKRVASAVGEGSMAIRQIHDYFGT